MPNRGRRLLAPIAVWEGAGAEHVEGGLPPVLPVLALQCEAVPRAKYGVVQYHFHTLEVHAWAVYLRSCKQSGRGTRREQLPAGEQSATSQRVVCRVRGE